MPTPATLQAYMRKAAARTHEVVAVPPFALYFHPTDSLRYYNYAVPVEPVGRVAPETLAALRGEFARRERLLRFEFIEEYAPALGPALAAAGLTDEGRHPLLVCTPETFHPAPPVAGLEVRLLDAAAPPADLVAFLTTQSRGFAETDVPEATETQAEELRARLADGGRRFLALLEGRPAAAGAFTTPLDGFTELVGIATLPACRRRGIAGALTATMTQAAFAAGVRVAFLSAEDENAGRVYERAGFRLHATSLAYCEG